MRPGGPPGVHANICIEFVLPHGHNLFFRELVDALIVEVAGLGVSTQLSQGCVAEDGHNNIRVVFPPHEAAVLGLRGIFDDPRLRRRTIAVCAEQPGSSFFHHNVELVRDIGAVFDLNPIGVDTLRGERIDARQLELGGFAPWLAADGPRDIDVLILASSTPRRLQAAADLQQVLSRFRSVVVLRPDTGPAASPDDNFVSGAPKRSLLARCRVVVNIHREPSDYLEVVRALDVLHAGAVLVTEPSATTSGLIAGTHYVESALAAMPDAIDAVLGDEARQQVIRHEGERWLHEHPMGRAAEQLVAAATALATRPAPTAALSPARSWPHVHLRRERQHRTTRPKPFHLELWGTFDVDNFGDQLFPVVFAGHAPCHSLAEALQTEQQHDRSMWLTLASAHGGVCPGWVGERLVGNLSPVSLSCRRIVPFGRAGFRDQTGTADAVVVAGGDVVHGGMFDLERVVGLEESYQFECVGIDVSRLAATIPVAYHAVGVPAAFAVTDLQRLGDPADVVRWSVRDQVSRRNLGAVVPFDRIMTDVDSVWALGTAWPDGWLHDRARSLRESGALPTGDYVAVHASFLDSHHDMLLCGQVVAARRAGLQVVLVSLGRCFGDDRRLGEMAARTETTAFIGRSVADRAAALTAASAYVGTALHGGVVAALAGVPVSWMRDVVKTRYASDQLGGGRITSPGEVSDRIQQLVAGDLPIDGERVRALSSAASRGIRSTLSAVMAATR